MKFLAHLFLQVATMYLPCVLYPKTSSTMKNFLSLKVQVAFLLITGLQLVFVPNMLLEMFGFETTTEVWVKVLGVVVLALCVLYAGILLHGNEEVIRFSVYARSTAVVGFILLVLTGMAKANLIAFAGIDLVTAIWTWLELGRNRQNT